MEPSGNERSAGRPPRRIRVLVVDDSAVVRQTLTQVLSSDPGIAVVGTAPDAYIAARKIDQERPDVLTLDLEMPGMDGLTFLRRLMTQRPMPVVICSALTGKGEEATLRALEYGAVDIILKPRLGARQFLEESAIRICDAVKAAAQARVRPLSGMHLDVAPKLTADAVLPLRPSPRLSAEEKGGRVVVAGASTGGTEAIRLFLQMLPPDCPPVVIVQHMPERFTAAFARRLDEICPMAVSEGRNGVPVTRGNAFIAPGNLHTLLRRGGEGLTLDVKEGPLVSRHRPSVNVLFRSAVSAAGPLAIGVLLTGMGDDGAQGLLELKQGGAATFAQDEATCVVYGMPKEAVKLGAVGAVLPLEEIAGAVMREAEA